MYFFNLLIFFLPILLTAPILLAQDDLKADILKFQEQLTQASPLQKGEIQKNLAIALFKDQEHEKAFRVFLEALETVCDRPSIPISEEETQLYEHALQVYLHRQGNPIEVANEILRDYSSFADAHKNYYVFNYIVAAAEAKTGLFPSFFERFYRSYRYYPNHYMAYKTKAALHIKLFNRARIPSEREAERSKILENGNLALEAYPHDPSLYKVLLSFTPENQRAKMLNVYLNKIIDNNIIITRTDLVGYVHKAVDYKQYEVAQRLLNKGRESYNYSRLIVEAQKYLDEAKANITKD